jgi:hypothetical protein
MIRTIEIWQFGQKVCIVQAHSLAEALRHTTEYVAHHEKNGEIKLKIKRSRKAMPR